MTNKGTFDSFEAWLHSESEIVFSKQASLAMVSYQGFFHLCFPFVKRNFR